MTKSNYTLIAGLLLALLTFASVPAQGYVWLDDASYKKTPRPDCAFPKLEMTPETKVHAVKAFFRLARPAVTSQETRLVKVTVNSPDEPVVLMLGGYESVVWHISWTEGSTIKGVLVNSPYPQKVIGLLDAVPVMLSSPNNSGAYAYYDVRAKGGQPADEVAVQLFGRRVDHFESALNEEQVLVGQPWPPGGKKRLTAAKVTPEDLRDPKRITPGMAGLQQAIRRGWLKKAELEDVYQYMTLVGQQVGLPDHLIPLWRPQASNEILMAKPYVVLSPDFVVPPGLKDDAFESVFILPEGLAQPQGDVQGFKFYSYDEVKSRPPAQPQEALSSACRFPGFSPPAGLKVFVSSADSVEPLGGLIGQSDLEVSLMRVTVNSPDAPAALILGSCQSTIWHLSWTEGTEIAAVVLNSQTRQIIVGLPETVPVLYIDGYGDTPPSCPLVSISSKDSSGILKVNQLANQLFKSDVAQYFKGQKGQVLIGEELKGRAVATAEEFRVEKFIDSRRPLRGVFALRVAEEKGLIRKATDPEKRQWLEKYIQKLGLPNEPTDEKRPRDRGGFNSLPKTFAWIILSPDFIMPRGVEILHAENTFIVPEGLPLPQGRPRSGVLFLKMDGTCVGPRKGCVQKL